MPALKKLTSPVQSSGSSTAKTNIAALEGLRAFAALGVVMLHTTYLIGHALINEYTYPWLSFPLVFGNTGVQLFFVLSGFLLFMPYAKALLFHESWPGARTFYMRRALRILPGYYFSLFMLVIFVQHSYLAPDHWPQLFLFLTFFMDSSHTTFQQINVPYWSLGVEVQFYLFLPFVALALNALVKRVAHTPGQRLRAGILACVGLMLVGLVVRFVGLQLPPLPSSQASFPEQILAGAQFLFFGVWGKFWEDFAIGMLVSLCFIYAQHPAHGQHMLAKGKQFSLWIGLSAVIVLIIGAIWNFRISYPVPQFDFFLPLLPYRSWLMDFFVSLGWGGLIATIVFGNRIFKAPFETRLMRWLGTISYSIYLWHLPILSLFKKYVFVHLSVTDVALSHLCYWTFFALVAIPWCFLVYWFVERPFMKLKDRPRSTRKPDEAPDDTHVESQLVASAD